MSLGLLPVGLPAYTTEDFESVIRPNGRRSAPKPPKPIAPPDLLLRVRRLTWAEAALAESDQPVPAARIRAWEEARSLALAAAPPTPPRRRLPGLHNRLLGGKSR